jgi:hypothetical protein
MLYRRVHAAGCVIRRVGRFLGPGLCALVTVLGATPPAAAQSDQILLLPLAGWVPRKMDAAVAGALPRGAAVVPADEAARAAKVLAQSTTGEDAAYASVGQQFHASVVIEGKVTKEDKWRLRLSVRRAADGAAVGSEEWSGTHARNLVSSVAHAVRPWIASTLAAARPEVSAAASPPAEAAVAASAAGEEVVRGSEPSIAEAAAPPRETPASLPQWELSVGPMVLARTFSYMDDTALLPGYTLAAGAGFAADGTFYPLVALQNPLRALGVSGALESSVAAKTVARNGAPSLDTSMLAYRLGLRYRRPVYRTLLTGGLDFAQDRSHIDVPDTTPPNVRYTFLRPSITGRLDTSALSLSLTVAYLHVLSVGQMGDDRMFPRDTVLGAEAEVGVGHAVDENFALKLVAHLRHFAHTMHAHNGDPYLVGGAVDEHFGVSFLVSYRGR